MKLDFCFPLRDVLDFGHILIYSISILFFEFSGFNEATTVNSWAK